MTASFRGGPRSRAALRADEDREIEAELRDTRTELPVEARRVPAELEHVAERDRLATGRVPRER